MDSQFGARPLKRLIQSKIATEVSKEILKENIKPEDTAVVNVVDGLVFLTKETVEENTN